MALFDALVTRAWHMLLHKKPIHRDVLRLHEEYNLACWGAWHHKLVFTMLNEATNHVITLTVLLKKLSVQLKTVIGEEL